MIKIVDQNKRNEITKYESNEDIPFSNSFSYAPYDYLEKFGINENTVSYLREVKDASSYIKQILELIELTFTDGHLYDLNRHLAIEDAKEERGNRVIKYGKTLVEKLSLLMEYEKLLPKPLYNIIRSRLNQRKALEDVYIPIDKYYSYQNVDPREIDIYYLLDLDVWGHLTQELPKFFTAHQYFTNIGHSYFSIDIDIYNVLVGRAKGKIPGYKEDICLRIAKSYDTNVIKDIKEKIRKTINEFTDFNENLAKVLLNTVNVLPNKSVMDSESIRLISDPIKNAMFKQLCETPEYKQLKLIIDKVDEYFVVMFNLGYFTYIDGILKTSGSLHNNSFAEFLKDKDFLFLENFESIKEPICKLLGKKSIKNFSQSQESQGYPDIKNILIKNKVPLSDKFNA